MPSTNTVNYPQSASSSAITRERGSEKNSIATLQVLKYEYRRRVMAQIVDNKKIDFDNRSPKSLLRFLKVFSLRKRDDRTCEPANNACHLAFNADERFLPISQFAV